MAYRIEIEQIIGDSRAASYKQQLTQQGFSLEKVYMRDVYTIDMPLSVKQQNKIQQLLANTRTQKAYVFPTKQKQGHIPRFNWAIEVGFLPGVTDNVGNTAKQSIMDMFGDIDPSAVPVYTSKLWMFEGTIAKKDIQRIANTLYNPLIQRVHIKSYPDYRKAGGMDIVIPKVSLVTRTVVDDIPILAMTQKELEELGKKGIKDPDGSNRGPLALRPAYMDAIKQYFARCDRNPTDIELESLAQTWSEHCKHTIFNDPIDDIPDGLFRHYIQRATKLIRKKKSAKNRSSLEQDICVSVFSDNSGAIIFDNTYLLTDKVETHNSPSALDPFGGAVTGIVGVNRDTLGFGLAAKPIVNRFGFCLASPTDQSVLYRDNAKTQKMLSARRIMEGVVAGVNTGGNNSGIPTTQGFMYFDKGYRGKPLVFAGTVGLIPKKVARRKSYEKKARPGDYIVMIGGRVGADGIHGATFSSESLSSGSPATAVQIGDPITQKKLSDALIYEIRDKNLYSSITDNGAGGLSCSVAEMARESNGFDVHLENVPLKYSGLAPWQIWISESQERMTLAVPPKNWLRIKKILAKHDVEATVIGTFTNTGRAIVRYHDAVIMDIAMEFLHNGLPKIHQHTKKLRVPKYNKQFPKNTSETHLLQSLLARPSLASIEPISNQYDHEVQASSVLKPLQGAGRVNGDATVVRPLFDSKKGVVLSHALYPSYTQSDPYKMAQAAIDTVIRNSICVGGTRKHLALLDNFCWCKSNDPTRLWQLKKACEGCFDAAVSYETPFISGKDSMFNDFSGFDGRGKSITISIPPTLLISSIGVVNDVENVVSIDTKCVGDLVYLLGETYDELGGSEYARMLSEKQTIPFGGNVPSVHTEKNKKLYDCLESAIKQQIVASAISVGRGGLGVAIAKKAMAGMHGVAIELDDVLSDTQTIPTRLFSESQGRILVTINPLYRKRFEKLFASQPYSCIGTVTDDQIITMTYQDKKRVKLSIADALRAYRKPLAQYKNI